MDLQLNSHRIGLFDATWPASSISNKKEAEPAKEKKVSTKPGWIVEPGWFSSGIPHLGYVPNDDKDLGNHLRNIEKYRQKQAVALDKAEIRYDREKAREHCNAVIDCHGARIKLLEQEQRHAIKRRDAIKTQGASVLPVDAAEDAVREWEKKLAEANKDMRGSREWLLKAQNYYFEVDSYVVDDW